MTDKRMDLHENIFRMGAYPGVIIGIGYATIFGYGWHTWLCVALCLIGIWVCANRVIVGTATLRARTYD